MWIKGLKKILTPEQQTLWQARNKERDARKRKQVVAKFVLKVDQQLFLTEEQFTQITQSLDTMYGDLLLKRRMIFLGLEENWEIMELPVINKDNNPLKKILTENQFKVWDGLFAKELRQLTQYAKMLNEAAEGEMGDEEMEPDPQDSDNESSDQE